MKRINATILLLTFILALVFSSCKSEDVFRNYAETESLDSSAIVSDITDTAKIITAKYDAKLIDFKHTVNAGENTSLTLMAEPLTEYRIEVEYSSGISRSKELYPKTSDHYGYVTWRWQVGTNCRSGEYPIRIYKNNELVFETRLTIK